MVLAACNYTSSEPERHVNKPVKHIVEPIVISDVEVFRSGNRAYTYRLLNYPDVKATTNASSNECLDPTKFKLGTKLLLTIPTYVEEGNTYMELPTDACVIMVSTTIARDTPP